MLHFTITLFRIAVTLCYYGLSISTNDLGGNRYIASMLSGAMEIPGYLLCYIGLEKYGGRLSFMLSSGASGLCLLITPVLFKGKYISFMELIWVLKL